MLTRQEEEIVKMVVVGATNSDIAEKLVISPLTVKTHLKNIYKKLSLNNDPNPRLKLIQWYYSQRS